MRRLVAAVTVVGSMAVATAACGGSSTPSASNGSGSTGNVTATFVSKGNAICKSANDQEKAIKQPADNAPLSDWADYLTKFESLAQGIYTQLQGLTPPAAKQSDFSTYLSDLNKAISDVKTAQQAAAHNDSTGFQNAVQKVGTDGSGMDSEAAALGLTECAKGSSGNSGTGGNS